MIRNGPGLAYAESDSVGFTRRHFKDFGCSLLLPKKIKVHEHVQKDSKGQQIKILDIEHEKEDGPDIRTSVPGFTLEIQFTKGPNRETCIGRPGVRQANLGQFNGMVAPGPSVGFGLVFAETRCAEADSRAYQIIFSRQIRDQNMTAANKIPDGFEIEKL